MDMMSGIFSAFAEALTKVLPLSPFRDYLSYFAGWQYLGWINWFFPFAPCLKILAAWTGAIAVYYGCSVVLRLIKVIGD